MPQPDFDTLGRKMCMDFAHINRIRRLVRVLTCVVYTAVVAWFAFCICTPFMGTYIGDELSENLWIYMLGGFGAFWILHYVLMASLTALTDREHKVMRQILAELFPDASFLFNGAPTRQMLADSRLFDILGASELPVSHNGYGCVKFRQDDSELAVYDVGVTSDKASKIMCQIPGLGFLATVYRSIVRPIFGTRIESSMHSFRGMFGYHGTSLHGKGAVIILPDNLEDKIGYLAHGIQSFRRKNEANLVVLEDPKFESLFAVYANDEVEARKVLTPVMMRRITKLRLNFGKELMLSFNDDKVYYASATSDGFLRLGRKSLEDVRLLEQIYSEINFCRTLIGELSRPLQDIIKLK